MTTIHTAQTLLAAFGPDLCLTDPDESAQWSRDQWALHSGQAAAILRPRTVADVSAMMRFCASHQIEVVPQGGNTGLVGGAIPDASGTQVVLSLARLNRVREIDPTNYTATVEAGCILADVQQAVAAMDRYFPLSFGAEGSCQIGGALSTNAGGHNVLRYGNARDLVLGLEVVLADGTLWEGLRKLRKDNTGYDLKHLFIGAEGTLGIITAAVLKLFPLPRARAAAIVSLSALDAAPDLLSLARSLSSDALSAFELIPRRLVQLAQDHAGPVHCVPADGADWFALLECTGSESDEALNEKMTAMLEAAFEAGHILDATIASSQAQIKEMWHLRDGVAEWQMKNGAVIYFDVSVPVSSVPDFIEQATAALKRLDAQVDVNAFGHVGDGNIHFNLLQPAAMSAEAFLGSKSAYEQQVHEVVAGLQGSFSAEHGIGSAKTRTLVEYKSPVELALMRSVRAALSRAGLNPEKLVPSGQAYPLAGPSE